MARNSKGTLSRTVMKATGLFGGTQVFSMLGSLVRNKLVAVFVGEAGIGLFGLFCMAVDLIGSVTQLGLRASAVKNVSAACESGTKREWRIITIVRRWGWMLGLLGAAVTMIASPFLSKSAFGNMHTIWPFALLSLAVFLNSALEAERAVLQGLHMLSRLARSTVWGVVAGCIIAIPIIYIWRIDGMAPLVLGYSLAAFLCVWIVRPKGKNNSVEKIGLRQTLTEGKGMARLGFYIMLAGSLTYAASYAFMTFLNLHAGIDELGCYNGGYTLAVRYAGFLFVAIGMEYFPRLSAAAVHGSRRMTTFMRHETVVLLPFAVTMASFMAALAPWAVKILYSDDFLGAVPMILFAAPAIVFRAASWCVAFTLIAADRPRAYVVCESSGAVLGLLLNAGGYMMWGIAGIGVSYTVYYLLYLLITSMVARRELGVTWSVAVFRPVAVSFVAVSAVAVLAFVGQWVAALALAVGVGAVSLKKILGR